MFCKNSGKELIPGKRFCGVCGTPVQNQSAPDKQEKKDKKTKKIVAIILAFVIVFISCATGCTFKNNKKTYKSEEEALRKAIEDYTTKQLLEFYYDDYDANGNKEAFAIAGEGAKDDFRQAEIIYVDHKKKPKTVDSNIDGHTNGIIKDKKTKFVSIEKEAEKPEDNGSYIYGVKEKYTYQPKISGKYRNVHQEYEEIVAEDPATGEKLVLNVDKYGELVTG